MQIPSKGRVVLFHEKYPGLDEMETSVAVITDCGPVGTPSDGMVTLVVFPAGGVVMKAPVVSPGGAVLGEAQFWNVGKVVKKVSAGGPNADQPSHGCWTWPPRV